MLIADALDGTLTSARGHLRQRGGFTDTSTWARYEVDARIDPAGSDPPTTAQLKSVLDVLGYQVRDQVEMNPGGQYPDLYSAAAQGIALEGLHADTLQDYALREADVSLPWSPEPTDL